MSRISRFLAVATLAALATRDAVADEAAWKAHLEAGKRAGQSRDYSGADQSFQLALREAEAFGPDDVRLGETLNLVGLTYTAERRLPEAESVLRRALRIRESALGTSHSDTNATRTNLANVFLLQEHPSKAEELYREAITQIERRAGPDGADLDQPLMSLSTLYLTHNRALEAEPLVRRALKINEQIHGPDGLRVQENLHQLASILQAQKKYDEAAAAVTRALVINATVLGKDHPQTGISLQILGRIRTAQGSYEEGQAALGSALAIFERSLPPQDHLVGETLRYYAIALQRSGRATEAREAERRAKELGF